MRKKVLENIKGDRVHPLGARLVVKVDKINTDYEVRDGFSIFLPPSAEEDRSINRGTVTAVGPGERLDSGELQPLNVQVNDRIIYGKYAGTEVKIDGVDHRILHFSDVLAVLEEE